MSRSIRSALLPAVFVCAAWLSPAPASAVEIANASFSLSFGDGWKDFTIGVSDKQAAAVKGEYGEEGYASLLLVAHQGDLSASELALYMKSYRQTDSILVIDQGTDTLGGKVFSFVEFQDGKPDDPSVEAPHYKLYLTPQSGYLFECLTYFYPSKNAGEVAEVESALATLKITASTGLRPVAASARPGFIPAYRDALGRSLAGANRGTLSFRLPAAL